MGFQGSTIKQELPPTVHVLTLELLEMNKFLLRLEHQYEASDPAPFNANVTISLNVRYTLLNCVTVVMKVFYIYSGCFFHQICH